MVELGDRHAPLGLDDGGGIRLGDDRRAVDALAWSERFAAIERRLVPGAGAEHADLVDWAACFLSWHGFLRRRIARRDRLHGHRLGDQRAAGHEEGELLAISGLELGLHL